MAKRNSSEEVKLTPSDEDVSDDEESNLLRASPRSSRGEDNGGDPGRHVHCTFCGSHKTVVKYTTSNGSKHIHCRSCGKESANQTGTCRAASGAALDLLYSVQGLPDVPGSTLEDTVSIEESENTSSAVRNESEREYNQPQREKIPEQGMCNFAMSVQNPHKGTIRITFFLMAKHYPDRWGIYTFYVYFVPSELFQQVYRIINRIEEGCHPVPLGCEHLGSLVNDYIHEMFIDEEVKVSFQMTIHSGGHFRIRYPLTPEVISSYDIRSKCHSRICPGAKAQLCVECLGDPEEICQGEVRVIIENGRLGTQKMVFPILAFGPSHETRSADSSSSKMTV